MGTLPSTDKPHKDTSQYGQIYLETDKTVYHAGETVTGKIFLNLISHYPGNQLFLKMKGREVVQFMGDETKDGKTQEKMFSEHKNIIKEETLVYSWDDTLAPGQFTIPFSFLLPQNLPASFHQQGWKYLAVIEYKLETFLKPHQPEIPTMKYKQPINLRETVIQNTENLSQEVKTPLESGCCCSTEKGSNLLKVNWEKNYYSPGENAQVSMELDNSESQLKNIRVIFSLYQSLQLRAEGETKNFHLVKVKQELSGSNRNAGSLNIILPRSPIENDFSIPTDKKSQLKWLAEFRGEGVNRTTSTTNSSLITSSFFLEVCCPMSGCCATVPSARHQIAILSPDFQLPAVSAPNNWQPVTLSTVTLAFPSDKHEPLLHEYNNLMDEHQVLLNSKNQVNLEMASISMSGHPQSNQMNSKMV